MVKVKTTTGDGVRLVDGSIFVWRNDWFEYEPDAVILAIGGTYEGDREGAMEARKNVKTWGDVISILIMLGAENVVVRLREEGVA